MGGTMDTCERRHRAFSLVELLVVLGIIGLVMGIILPAVANARKSAKTTACLNNLRQIGAFYVIYANGNRLAIPIGTTAIRPDESHHTRVNNLLLYDGQPGSAAGPLLLAGLFDRTSVKMLHCPLEKEDELTWDVQADHYERFFNKVPTTIQISYSVRPVESVWIAGGEGTTYPRPMPQLHKLKNRALIAERPQAPSRNHGQSRNPTIQVLYTDGSVRASQFSAYKAEWKDYTALPNPGWDYPTNIHAMSVNDDPGLPSIWNVLDRN